MIKSILSKFRQRVPISMVYFCYLYHFRPDWIVDYWSEWIQFIYFNKHAVCYHTISLWDHFLRLYFTFFIAILWHPSEKNAIYYYYFITNSYMYHKAFSNCITHTYKKISKNTIHITKVKAILMKMPTFMELRAALLIRTITVTALPIFKYPKG